MRTRRPEILWLDHVRGFYLAIHPSAKMGTLVNELITGWTVKGAVKPGRAGGAGAGEILRDCKARAVRPSPQAELTEMYRVRREVRRTRRWGRMRISNARVSRRRRYMVEDAWISLQRQTGMPGAILRTIDQPFIAVVADMDSDEIARRWGKGRLKLSAER